MGDFIFNFQAKAAYSKWLTKVEKNFIFKLIFAKSYF
jgi:hypothetical protein